MQSAPAVTPLGAEASPPVPSGASSPWLFSRTIDLLVFVGPVVLAVALLSFGDALGISRVSPVVFLGCIVAVDVAHVHGTLYRVYFDGAEVRRRPLLYLGTPVALLAAGVLLHRLGGSLLFWRVLAYVAVWHFIRQQIGWVALYRARAKEHENPRRKLDAFLDPAVVYAATLYPIIDWHTRLPRPYWWFLEGDFVPGLSRDVAMYARAVWAVLLLAFAARQLGLLLRGEQVSWGKVIIVASTAFLWWLGIVHARSDYAFTLTNVLPHGIPYIALAVVYASRRYADKNAPPAPIGAMLVRFGVAACVGFLIALALFEEALWDRFVWHDHAAIFGDGPTLSPLWLSIVVPLLALPQVTHYVLDGFVWKRAKNPDLGQRLQPLAPRRSPADRSRAT